MIASSALHFVPTLVSKVTHSEDPALRPTSFDDFIGQTEVIANLRQSVRAAKRGGWQLDHVLFTGPAGLGKTSLAGVITAELGGKLHMTSAPTIEHKGALASLLTTLEDGDVLFIDEIHALNRPLAETIYSALEDRMIDLPAGKKVIRVPLPKFTLLGATTHAGMLPKPLLDRFGLVCQLRFYDVADLATIVLGSADRLGVAIDEEAAAEIARRSRGTPRLANRLLRRVRDFVLGTDASSGLMARRIGGSLAAVALEKLGVDDRGLGALDRAYLAAASRGPIGIEAITSALSEQRATIEDAVEPFLVQLGFVARTRAGRVATEAGMQHLSAATSA